MILVEVKKLKERNEILELRDLVRENWKELEYSEMGMLSVLALKKDTMFTLNEIVKMKSDGIAKVKTILKKLENHGFCVFSEDGKKIEIYIEGVDKWLLSK